MIELCEKAADRLAKVGDKLIAKDVGLNDPLPALRKKLAKVKLPTVAVVVVERHLRRRPDPGNTP